MVIKRILHSSNKYRIFEYIQLDIFIDTVLKSTLWYFTQMWKLFIGTPLTRVKNIIKNQKIMHYTSVKYHKVLLSIVCRFYKYIELNIFKDMIFIG